MNNRLPLTLALLCTVSLVVGASPPGCKKPKLNVFFPLNGEFISPEPSEAITIEGNFGNLALSKANVKVGPPCCLDDATIFPDKTWAYDTFYDASRVFNPFIAELYDQDNRVVKKRVTAIIGNSVADGAFSPESLALRFNDLGFDQIEPVLPDLVGDALDIEAFLQPGQDLGNGATLNSASIDGFEIDANSMNGFLRGTTTVLGLFLDVSVDVGIGTCGLHITANALDLVGDYDLLPAGNSIDVNQIGDVNPVFSNFQSDFVSGICSVPLIEQIVNAIVGDLESQVANGLRDQLKDPDGAGPLDSPIAAGVEEGLSGIDIGGQVGALIGVSLETPGFLTAEDDSGVTFGAHARVTANIGTGPGQCQPGPGSPDLDASLEIPTTFPTFDALTPGGNLPYGLGIGLSPSAFNQLFKAATECGLLDLELTQLEIVPGSPVPITAALLASFDPAFAAFPLDKEFTIVIHPTLAPVVTASAGPAGELSELRMGAMRIDVVEVDPATIGTVLAAEADLAFGMNIQVDQNGIVPVLSAPQPGDITVSIVKNPLGTNEAFLELLLPALLGPLFPTLGNTLGSFPLPSFLGVDLSVVEVGKEGSFLAIYANLSPP